MTREDAIFKSVESATCPVCSGSKYKGRAFCDVCGGRLRAPTRGILCCDGEAFAEAMLIALAELGATHLRMPADAGPDISLWADGEHYARIRGEGPWAGARLTYELFAQLAGKTSRWSVLRSSEQAAWRGVVAMLGERKASGVEMESAA